MTFFGLGFCVTAGIATVFFPRVCRDFVLNDELGKLLGWHMVLEWERSMMESEAYLWCVRIWGVPVLCFALLFLMAFLGQIEEILSLEAWIF